MTPPALARMSGMTKTPLSARMSSAAAVVGPLAPSQRMLALDAVGVAAGDDVFGGGGNEDLAVEGEEFVLVGCLGAGEAVMVPARLRCSMSAWMSMPFVL